MNNYDVRYVKNLDKMLEIYPRTVGMVCVVNNIAFILKRNPIEKKTEYSDWEILCQVKDEDLTEKESIKYWLQAICRIMYDECVEVVIIDYYVNKENKQIQVCYVVKQPTSKYPEGISWATLVYSEDFREVELVPMESIPRKKGEIRESDF